MRAPVVKILSVFFSWLLALPALPAFAHDGVHGHVHIAEAGSDEVSVALYVAGALLLIAIAQLVGVLRARGTGNVRLQLSGLVITLSSVCLLATA